MLYEFAKDSELFDRMRKSKGFFVTEKMTRLEHRKNIL
jgi:hypothetical protein